MASSTSPSLHGAPPFVSRRSPVLSRKGMVACTQTHAANAGAEILRAGGNAADAAVAIAAAMAVTEPCSTGLGGDCFCLYYDAATKRVSGLNGSGRCPVGLSLDRAQAAAHGSMGLPALHPYCVTAPGAAAGWVDTAAAFGSGMAFADILAPAIRLAAEGFPVAPLTAHHWAEGVKVLRAHPSSHADELLIGGAAPAAGQVFSNPTMASTLSSLAAHGKAGFYEGPVADAIVNAVAAAGGVLSHEDLRAHTSTHVDPISVDFRGIKVWEIPPNGQGITALLAMNILQALPAALLASHDHQGAPTSMSWITPFRRQLPPSRFAHLGHNSASYLHAVIEATRLAFADARWYVADQAYTAVPVAELLSRRYAVERAASLLPSKAQVEPARGAPVASSDTVSFQVVDAAGNACSFINSNYMGFGSGIVPKGCGFSLQNRGANFSLEPGHPNLLAPGKRPYHTIIPGMATWADDDSLFASFSVMGGFMQPQGHVQVMLNMIEFGMDPQTALDAPRFCIAEGTAGGAVYFEDGINRTEVAALARMGHHVAAEPVTGFARSLFGRGQIIVRDRESGVLWGGSDGRGDGCALGL